MDEELREKLLEIRQWLKWHSDELARATDLKVTKITMLKSLIDIDLSKAKELIEAREKTQLRYDAHRAGINALKAIENDAHREMCLTLLNLGHDQMCETRK